MLCHHFKTSAFVYIIYMFVSYLKTAIAYLTHTHTSIHPFWTHDITTTFRRFYIVGLFLCNSFPRGCMVRKSTKKIGMGMMIGDGDGDRIDDQIVCFLRSAYIRSERLAVWDLFNTTFRVASLLWQPLNVQPSPSPSPPPFRVIILEFVFG